MKRFLRLDGRFCLFADSKAGIAVQNSGIALTGNGRNTGCLGLLRRRGRLLENSAFAAGAACIAKDRLDNRLPAFSAVSNGGETLSPIAAGPA